MKIGATPEVEACGLCESLKRRLCSRTLSTCIRSIHTDKSFSGEKSARPVENHSRIHHCAPNHRLSLEALAAVPLQSHALLLLFSAQLTRSNQTLNCMQECLKRKNDPIAPYGKWPPMEPPVFSAHSVKTQRSNHPSIPVKVANRYI